VVAWPTEGAVVATASRRQVGRFAAFSLPSRPDGTVLTLVAVLRDWIQRRKNLAKIVVTLGDASMEVERPTFVEREQLLEAFLNK
jgi:hypothetical protein